MWEFFFFFLMDQQLLGIFSSPWNLKQYLREERSTYYRNVVNVREKPCLLAEQQTHEVMEMDVIKTSRQEKKKYCRDVFSYSEDSEARPSFFSPSFSSPWAELTLACPDRLESVPGKTGHLSLPIHLTPPPSPLLLNYPEANLLLHLTPWVRTGETTRVLYSILHWWNITKKQCPHCWGKVLYETTFFFHLIYRNLVPKWTHVCIWQSKLLFVPLLSSLGDNRPVLKVKLQMC